MGMEDVMGTRDMLVTNQDLGSSIDGSESLVQENSDHAEQHTKPHVAKQHVEPEKPVSSKDDRAESFYSTDVAAVDESAASSKHLNADADLEFQRQRKAEGVQA